MRRQFCQNSYVQILYLNIYKIRKYLKKEDFKTAGLEVYQVVPLLTENHGRILVDKNLSVLRGEVYFSGSQKGYLHSVFCRINCVVFLISR